MDLLVTRSFIATHNSSLGRLGLLIHSTAGFIDPGWDGHVTLELSNVANLPITIYYGMKIGQLSFVQLTEPAAVALRQRCARLEVPGQRGPDAESLLEELRGRVSDPRHGGSGFVGPKVVHALRARDLPVRCSSARRSDAVHQLESWGCELIEGEMTDAESLRRAVDGAETVVHLVAIRQGKPAEFERVMIQGTRDLVEAAKVAGAGRIVLMSALGASEETKDLVPYYRAKWEMEQTVQRSGLDHVIFRPSFIFARDGGILATFKKLARLAPVTPVIGPGTQRIQPIWVDDVAEYYARAVDSRGRDEPNVRARRRGRGDVERVLGAAQALLGVRRRPTLHMPIGFMRLNALVTERLPGNVPLTRDLLKMLEGPDNTGDVQPAVETLGVEPMPLDEQLRRGHRPRHVGGGGPERRSAPFVSERLGLARQLHRRRAACLPGRRRRRSAREGGRVALRAARNWRPAKRGRDFARERRRAARERGPSISATSVEVVEALPARSSRIGGAKRGAPHAG